MIDGGRHDPGPDGPRHVRGPAAAGGAVYAGTSDGRFVQAVDAETGRERWRFETPSSVWTSPAVAGGVVYVGDNAGFVRALDRDTGEELWSFGTGGRVQSSPVPDGGSVFVGSDDGGVYALVEGPGVHRAVFWDSTRVRASWYRGHRELRDYLSVRGYQVVDAGGLAVFLRERIGDGRPSVLVGWGLVLAGLLSVPWAPTCGAWWTSWARQ